MRIAYLSRGLCIHDHRFLEKLVHSEYDVWLITYYDGAMPASIPELPNLHIVHWRSPARPHPRRYDWRILPWQLLCRFRTRLGGTDGLLSGFSPGREGASLSARHPIVRLGDLFLARQYRHFVAMLQAIQPDIVHAGWVQSDGFIAAASGFHPLLLMPWGSDILLISDRSPRERAITEYTIQRADMIACDCEVVKNKILALANYPPERIVVFPWGIDLRLFRPDPVQRQAVRARLGWSGSKVIVMMRNFAPVYAVDDFLRALPAVVHAEPDVRVLMIGRGPLEASLRQLADKLGLVSYLYWTGFVENSQLPRYLNAADLYVSSSLSDGTAVSHLEAMACGLPVVLTDTPSSFEWVTDRVNGRIAPRQNPEALSTAIIGLLQDSEQRRAMGERNVAIVRERADWDRNFARLEEMYEALYREERKGGRGSNDLSCKAAT
jgi:glycosyltransferase involved in cell wall biosynthesis